MIFFPSTQLNQLKFCNSIWPVSLRREQACPTDMWSSQAVRAWKLGCLPQSSQEVKLKHEPCWWLVSFHYRKWTALGFRTYRSSCLTEDVGTIFADCILQGICFPREQILLSKGHHFPLSLPFLSFAENLDQVSQPVPENLSFLIWKQDLFQANVNSFSMIGIKYLCLYWVRICSFMPNNSIRNLAVVQFLYSIFFFLKIKELCEGETSA